ncbi:MAG: HisA/HisF-related TIM barrel protein [Ardenticatenaceae bacterium]|nr:HisA/HisF-related TIM barrel protein [Ardenticatenaceae bacterium]
MQVIPVLDLKANTVVHGVAGTRDRYQPVASRLVHSSDPCAVLEAFATLGAKACYIADLDAIAGVGHHRELYPRLAAVGVPLWIDAGVASPADAQMVLAAGAARVIIGLETLPSLARAAELLETPPCRDGAVGRLCPRRATAHRATPHREPPHRGVSTGPMLFSLDLRAGQPVTTIPELCGLEPLEVLARLHALRWRHFILLDVARVGTSGGPPLAFVRAAREAFPQIEIVSGGGVRDHGDLAALAAAGCDAALVATALHRGVLGAEVFGSTMNAE